MSPLRSLPFASSPLSRFASCFAALSAALLSGALFCAEAQVGSAQAEQQRARHFAAARQALEGASSSHARTQAQAMRFSPRANNFTAPWTPLGPSTIVSPAFGNLTGRVTAVATDPNDSTGNTVYLGTTGGGVWKSRNAAGALASLTFAPLTDALAAFSGGVTPSLSIGAVAVQPASTAVVLAGTGDPNDASDSLFGEGLLRSADGGATWTLIQTSQDGVSGVHTFAGLSTAAIAWSSSSPQLAVAAMSVSPEAAAVGAKGTYSVAGLYYSSDAGVTWHMSTLYDGASTVPAGSAATAVVWDALRGSFYAAVRGHGYYASTDGATWKRLAAQPGAGLTATNCPAAGSSSCAIFRGALAVQPTTGDLYAWTVDATNKDQGLWQDLCSATNGACATTAPVWGMRLDGGALETSGTIPQGDYDLALSAAPTGTGTLLLAGAVDLWRCSLATGATSCVWRDTTNALNGCNASAGVAPAQHAIAAAGSAPIVFLGNDGGLWRSTDGVAETGSVCAVTDRTHFENLNGAIGEGGSLAEVVGLALSPSDANVLLGGFGAIGSAGTAAASSLAAWPQLSAGEGGLTAIDPMTATNWYASIGAGVAVKQCALGAGCAATDFAGTATVGEAQVAYDAAEMDAPWMLDPAAPTELIAATCRMWRGSAASGAAWSASNAISTAFGGGATPCGATTPLVRSVGAGGPVAVSSNAQNAGSKVIYAGLAGAQSGGTAALGGHVFMTASANTATNATVWTDVAKSPVTNDTRAFNAGGFDVSAVVVDAHDATGATVYAVVSGFGVAVVYRSVDFGAHWVNATANLPLLPASALVVDPNDANTVYLATDAGVYATQAVATCATASCWTLMGTGLPNSPAVALAAGAALATGDGRSGMLRVGTYGRGIWQTPLLTAVAPTSAAMTAAPGALAFAAQQVSNASTAQTVTVTSTGTAALTVSSVVATGDFSETDTCAGKTVAVGSTCMVSVVFGPSAVGARTGVLTVYANVAGGQATVSLSGTAVAAPSVVLTPTSLTFASTTVNQPSAAQTLTVSNTGGSPATISSITASGDFAVSANTCGATLASQTACAVSVVFTPTASGARAGVLTVVDSAGTQSAALSGTGSSPATDTLTPGTLTFGAQTLNTVSAPQVVTLTNSGDAALTLITASTGSSEFPVGNGCGATLAGKASCAISVTFAPTATGTRTATLTVGDQFRTQTIALSGTGIAPAGVSLTPSALAFGSIGVGQSSPPQIVTLTNNGGVALTTASLVTSGDYVLASTTCGTALAVNSACVATVLFHPTVAGTQAGTLTLTGSVGTQTVALSGTGVDFALAANGPTSATISGSSLATYSLLLSSLPSVTSTAALSCSGVPAHTTCVVTPTSVSLGSDVKVTVVVTTGVAGASAAWWIAVIFGVVLLRKRKRWVSLLCLLVLAGCGTGRTIPADSGTTTVKTASGTYSLTVTATAAGVSHAVPLTLVVQ